MSKVFVDTNILIYAADFNERSKQHKAREALLKLKKEGTGVISIQVAGEFYVASIKKLGFRPLEAKHILGTLDYLEVVPIEFNLIKEAIDISILNQLSYWDGLIVAAAQEAGCDTILSEDFSHQQTFKTVKIENIFK